jgi:competence protein ComEC
MLNMLAFIYGVSIFFIFNIFPYSTIILSILILSSILYQGLKEKRDNTISTIKNMTFLILAILIGFYYAKSSYKPDIHLPLLSGKYLYVQCISLSEPLQISEETGRFSQMVRIYNAYDEKGKKISLKRLKLIGNYTLNHNNLYTLKIKIPRDSYFLNPSNNVIKAGILVEPIEIRNFEINFLREKRTELNTFFKNNFSEQSYPFLMSIITGERGFISKELRDYFNKTGLSHILSISGAHFGLLSFILFLIIRSLIRLLPDKVFLKLTLYITPSQIAAIICLPFMIGYLGISNMSIPSVRAFIMISLFLVGLLIDRKGFWLNTLIISAFIILLIEPESITEPSFHLSYIAVLCIGSVADRVKEEKRQDLFLKKKVFLFLKDTAIISLAVTIGTAPLIAYIFHYLSILSPITNIIITPVIGFIILPLTFLSAFLYITTGYFPLLTLIDKTTSLVILLIKKIGQFPFADIKIPAFPIILLVIFYSGVLLYIVLNFKYQERKDNLVSKKKILPLSPLILSFIPFVFYLSIKIFSSNNLQITYLDVGQGDSAVVELPDKKVILVDTGKNSYPVKEFLRYRGIKTIDALILSHGSSDHSGGLWNLIKDFEIKEIWDNGMLLYPEEIYKKIKIRSLQRGDVISGKGYKIIILHPYKGFYTLSSGNSLENNFCLVFKLQGNNKSFLFTGDIEREVLDEMVALKEHIKCDVYKVAHHGSKTSFSEDFIYKANPEFSIISVGRNNIYNHPHDEIINLLKGSKIFRTDRDGAIKLTENDNKIEIKTFREFQFEDVKNLNDELKNIRRLFIEW